MQFDIKRVVFDYDVGKNIFVKERCGFGFEDAIEAIRSGRLLDIIEHPNKKKYLHQYVLVIEMENYVFSLPSVYDKDKNEFFLKTMYPSRKLTKEYL